MRILIPGLAIGTELGFCNAHNCDITWIAQYPSTLLWVDKLIVSELSWRSMVKNRMDKPFERSLSIIMQIAQQDGLVEIINPNQVFNNTFKETLEKSVQSDLNRLATLFPEKIDIKTHSMIEINGQEYCVPMLLSAYASLALAQETNSHCMFGERTLNYFKYKNGLEVFSQGVYLRDFESFRTVFEGALPCLDLFPDYVIESMEKETRCIGCLKHSTCKDRYLLDVERNIKEILKARHYDEIACMIKEMKRIITCYRQDPSVSPEEIFVDFLSRKEFLERRVRSYFPKIRRWCHLGMMVSAPVCLLGSIKSHSLAIGAAAVAAASTMASEGLKYLESKYNWIFFSNKTKDDGRSL